MKKLISLILTAALMSGGLALDAFSSGTLIRTIPGARITINTKDMDMRDAADESPMSYVSVPDNQYYVLDSAEWAETDKVIRPGSRPRIKVLLEAIPKESRHNNYDLVYLFRGSYSAANISLTRGSFEKAEVKDSGYFLEVTLTMDPINGKFDPPESAEWTEPLGTASWKANEVDSGYHEIICKRGGTTVKKLSCYGGLSYNFYPYMTKAGNYSFRIRTVADPVSKTGKSSDWTESGELYIADDKISDGSGQTTADEGVSGGNVPQWSSSRYPAGTGTENFAGWMEQNGATYFIYPNGEYAKSGWMKLGGSWYMFDDSGRRLYGWQKNKYGKWFYLDPSSGIMKTGWLKYNNNWYYLDTSAGDREGCMISGWLTWNNEKYYFNPDGAMVTGWYKADGYYRYFYPEGSTGGAYGYMARNTSVGDFSFDENGIWK